MANYKRSLNVPNEETSGKWIKKKKCKHKNLLDIMGSKLFGLNSDLEMRF